MNVFQNKVLWFGILLAGICFVVLFFVVRESRQISGPIISLSPSAVPTATLPISPLPSKKPTLDREKIYLPTPPPRSLITGPATCQLGGSIEFINENLYETKGAKISYQNVDDPIRLIYWKVTPDNGALRVGPNVFSQFSNLPNGEKEIGVSLNKPATVKSYILTAMISYGVIKPNGAEEIRNSDCSGSIALTLP